MCQSVHFIPDLTVHTIDRITSNSSAPFHVSLRNMNNDTANATSISSTVASQFIQETYLVYVQTLVDVSILTLLFHAMVSAIPHEMKFMWSSSRPFSIVNCLYAFTRYGSLIAQALLFWLDFVPLGRLCNSLANVLYVVFPLVYIGVQGLLIARAYSLCSGNKVIAGTFAFYFLGGLISDVYSNIISGGCAESHNAEHHISSLVGDICVILTDLLAFCICLWKVWGTWKLKRETGIQGNNNLVSLLLRQTVSRFCFVIIINLAATILYQFLDDFFIGILTSFQQGFSAILLNNFTLELRQRNSAAIQATNATLPSIRFQNVGNYVHQSILVEMGDSENPDTREGGDDDFLRSPDVEIRREESTQDHT